MGKHRKRQTNKQRNTTRNTPSSPPNPPPSTEPTEFTGPKRKLGSETDFAENPRPRKRIANIVNIKAGRQGSACAYCRKSKIRCGTHLKCLHKVQTAAPSSSPSSSASSASLAAAAVARTVGVQTEQHTLIGVSFLPNKDRIFALLRNYLESTNQRYRIFDKKCLKKSVSNCSIKTHLLYAILANASLSQNASEKNALFEEAVKRGSSDVMEPEESNCVFWILLADMQAVPRSTVSLSIASRW
ncbi:hypothetical protein BDB00DRAFT_937035 [Zychaea mexicana]|uniref:uncharacterized protein n=1 Tax=Zychaea mexicana TaxID=64656 RepID=UPI0022FE3412|nr:uncharacterized protein BDB00DRAFT_937035 [Zychaea mexicana]KAI9496213.1 hypothetical protein BDB00DRAFT_937035 [Zychaea mexicana]